jgi:Protein of unknown function (DUF 659)
LNAFQLCRPDVKLSTRKELSSALLNQCYDDVKKKIDSYLASSPYHCITSDGWSNIKNEPIINYVIVSPSVSLFLESIYTGEKSHNAQFLSDDISRIIEKLSSSHVVGAVTDNTSTNKVSWSLLKQRFPGRFFQGCASHCLHLLVKDIFCATKTKRGQNVATYPDDYPFEYLLEIVAECKELVSFFHKHHFYQALLTKSLQGRGLRMLQPPAPTRWGSIQECVA